MACPNKNHPDWKSLVNEKGEVAAMQDYINNGDDIPNQDGSKKSKRTRVTVEQEYDNGGRYFNSKSTLDSMEKHPEVARKMIDELHKLFPWVNVNKDGLFDKDGKWLEIPEGKQGRHYRSAFNSAVAWSNDSSLETPPHEYAHEYIDMYRNAPLVKDAIAKYGEERLVTLIGRKYAGNKMSTTFDKFMDKFWKLIKNTFGTPSVVDILTDSFAKNEKLAEPFLSETAVHNFQDSQEPKYKKSTIKDFNADVSKNTTPNKIVSRAAAINKIQREIKNDETVEDVSKTLTAYWHSLIGKASKITKDSKGEQTEYAGLAAATIKDVSVLISEVDGVVIDNVSRALKGEDISLSSKEDFVLNTMLNLVRAIDKKIEVQNSYLTDDQITNGSIVNDISTEELSKSNIQRKKNLNSKNKYVRELAKALNKGLTYITNTRLWAKYLSGGENSMFSTVVYKGLNDAREDFAKFRFDFEDMFKGLNNDLFAGSEFHNPKADISDLETKSFSLDSKLNRKIWSELDSKEIILTKAEQIAIYLMDRQADKKGDLREGIFLEEIRGRDYDLGHQFVLTEEQILGITSEMEADASVSDFVSSIDKATKYSYDNTNPQFMDLNGYALDNFENYFPTSHGPQNLKISKKKNVVEDMRSMRLRTPGAGAVRLVDPYKALSTMKMANASYSAYAKPIHNAQNMIDSVQKKFNSKDDIGYLKAIQGTINKIQDSGTLNSSHGENVISKGINKLQGNFAVALLAKNLGVVLKQQVSLETATNEIDRKYIRKSGSSLGPVSFVNPFKLLKALTLKGDETMMPVEWTQAEKSEEYDTLMKYPMFRERFGGIVSKESGEALMGRELAEDKIKMPFIKKDGKPIYITKSRLMKGIAVMDALTVIRLFNAVKLETQDRMSEPKFAAMTEEQVEKHNIARLQEIVDKTQPTFDQINRTGLSQNNNPIARSLTMFSSATSKMGMGMTESLIDYLNNPTPEGLRKFRNRMISTGVVTSMMITTIDLMRHAALNGWTEDDDDELFEKYAISSLTSTAGTIQGVGGVMGIIISQMDSNPWYKTMQDPTQHIIQEGSEGVANLLKGNVGRAVHQGVGTYAKVRGLPFSIYGNTEKITKSVFAE
jgi:hypothetical protein